MRHALVAIISATLADEECFYWKFDPKECPQLNFISIKGNINILKFTYAELYVLNN